MTCGQRVPPRSCLEDEPSDNEMISIALASSHGLLQASLPLCLSGWEDAWHELGCTPWLIEWHDNLQHMLCTLVCERPSASSMTAKSSAEMA
jgi:hypothetical protein